MLILAAICIFYDASKSVHLADGLIAFSVLKNTSRLYFDLKTSKYVYVFTYAEHESDASRFKEPWVGVVYNTKIYYLNTVLLAIPVIVLRYLIVVRYHQSIV